MARCRFQEAMPSYSARHIQSQRKVFEYPSSERDLDMRIEAFYIDSNHSDVV
jgi:hypothetical protein